LNAARFLGQEGVAGSLAATKYADLVLLRENPLANIEATRSIEAVIAKGRFLSRDELDAMLDRAREGARALDAAQASSGPGQ
jgi:imidazolonepropionase-like amidohydrolase